MLCPNHFLPAGFKLNLVSKHRKKKDLPQKVCPVCKRPFTWRKKWEKVWEEVIYCSERCRRNKNKNE
jgi:hypothetical protein